MAYPLSASQAAVVNIALGVAKQLNAPYNALVALIYAGMGESNLSPEVGVSVGVWQSNPGDYNNGQDIAGQARGFLTGGVSFQAGGAIACANRGDPPWKIANEVEANQVYNTTGGDSYAGRVSVTDAAAIVAQYGGGASVPKGGTAGLGGTGTVAPSQGLTQQLTIGGVSNQDENYWVGMNRIASQVYWYLFSDGERLYYMDGADLIAQTPAAYINREADAENIQRFSLHYDDTAYQYASTHRRRGRVQHRTRLAKVTSPTEAQIDIICVIDFYRAGDVVVLENFGPGDGRWLVADCTRSVFSVFSSLTLVPPIMPLSEAEAAGTLGRAGKAGGMSSVDPKTGKAATGAPTTNTALGPTTNPIPGAIGNRLDQGFDGTTQTFLSPFNGTVVYSAASDPGWSGGGYVAIAADAQTSWVYYAAEGLTPTVSQGEHVSAGQSIATPRPNPYNGITGNFEIGRANPAAPGQPLAQVISNPAAMVLEFYSWIRSLGGPVASSTGNAGFR